MINFKEIGEKFKSVIESRHSDFYKRKYDGFDKLSEAGFKDLPFLTREELQDYPAKNRLYVPESEVEFVAYSSGTVSQKPLITYYSHVKNYRFDPSLGLGVKRILFIFPPINKHFSHTLVQQCQESGNGAYPIFGDINNLSNSAVIAADCEIDSIYATPTIANIFSDHLKKYYDAKKIRLVGLCGEALSAVQRSNLQSLYPSAKIVNLYAASEIGQFILYPCRDLIDNGIELFHPQDPLSAAELIDGELVLTYLANPAMPLIRYKTGDMFEVADSRCSCGKETLRWVGRFNSDIVRISGLEFKVSDLDYALEPMAELLRDSYQIHFFQKPAGGRIDTELIVELEMLENENIAKQVLDRLMNNWRLSANAKLKDAVEKGFISVPTVKFVKEFSVKTEKRKKLINHI